MYIHEVFLLLRMYFYLDVLGNKTIKDIQDIFLTKSFFFSLKSYLAYIA